MLGFMVKKLSISSVDKAVIFPHRSSKPLIKFKAFLSSPALKSSTPHQSSPKGDAFTVSYLVNSCGVANDAAKRISKYVNLKSAEKPSRTLSFFKACGFTDTQISTIVRIVPRVLRSNPDKTLKPKFDLFASLGAPPEVVLKIISNCPPILMSSVDNKMVPVLNCFKSVAGSNDELLHFLARTQLMLAPVNYLERKFAVLREFGMSNSQIWRFILMNVRSPSTPPDRLKVMAEKALAMGFDPRKHHFGDAIHAFTAIPEDLWDRKVNTFKKWGWSDSEFLMAFKKQPKIMEVSEKKIERIMDYLANTMGVDASVIAGCPNVLLLSLENRIIPRCSVVRLLVSKGLIEKDGYNISSLLVRRDEDFLILFVKRYKEMQEELMEVYCGLKKKAIRESTSYAQGSSCSQDVGL